MKSEFTGRHMTAVLVGGFGIVIAVNLSMATLATRGFGGVVVENSYVASQKYNGWLDQARKQQALGWSVDVKRQSGGTIALDLHGVPDGADVTAQLRRPLGEPETTELAFAAAAPGRLVSTTPVAAGRWIARIAIEAGGDRWAKEVHIE